MDALATLPPGLAPAIAGALLDSLWQGALIALVAAAVLAALANRSAALRHSVGLGFLLAMVAVPLLGIVGAVTAPGEAVTANWLVSIAAPVVEPAPGVFVRESRWLANAMTTLWLCGVGLMLLRHFGGWRLVGALDRNPYELLPPDWQQRVLTLQRALGIRRRVQVRLGAEIAAPFTARLLRPVIWLPLSLIARLPIDQVEALVAHELAHIRRLDWLWNGLQCVIESLLFYHPAAWWLGRRIRQEREHACDDLAVAACGNAIALAEALAELESQRLPFPRLVLTAHGGSLMQRITRLLNGSTLKPGWRLPAALAILLASGTLLATQVDVHGSLASIGVSSDGTLGPGDSRQITTDHQFYYGSVDRKGKLSEVYKVDGVAKPIDAKARVWINKMSNIKPPPAPPAPPAAPAAPPAAPAVAPISAVPPAPPVAPAAPPAPPAPPAVTDSQSFKALLRLVVADAGVAAAVGAPARVTSEVDGRIELDGANGEADLDFELAGPKGRTTVHVNAERTGSVWKIQNITLSPPGA